MTSITTRAGKGSPLTHNEVDANFTNLNTDKLDTAGIALGSAASPTIKFTGDLNTGIYSPGADQLAVSTAGTGRLFVDASGRVGVGTSSPGAALQVLLASSYAPGAAWDNKTVAFGGTSSTSGAVGIAYDDTNGGYIASIIPGSSWKPLALRGSVLVFATDVAGERARIDSSGRVGIGTSSPTTLLDVNADTVRVRTARTPASATATGATGEICWDANYIYICTATNTWKRSAISTW